MEKASYYIPLLSQEVTQVVRVVGGAIYAYHNKLSEWPIEGKKKPFGLSELVFAAIVLANSTSAYRHLTKSRFNFVQIAIERFMWDEYRHVHRYLAEISNLLPKLPDTEILLDYLLEHTDFRYFLMDAEEYAEEPKRKELISKGLIFKKLIMTKDEFEHDQNKYKITEREIKTHHLLLSTLADCGCCPFKPTPVAKKLFRSTARNIYSDCRYPKVPLKEEDWLANVTLRVRIEAGQRRVEVASGCGTFTQFLGYPTANDLNLRLFIPTRPPLFLESEMKHFEQLLLSGCSEKELQVFIENHSNFLRALGFGGFRAQIHLKPQGPNESVIQSSSLYIDLLAENLTGSKATIIELKRVISPLLKGSKRRKNIASSFSDALRQLEDYATFFEDNRNKEWFIERYGQDIGCPELMLVIGREDLSRIGLPSILHSPIKSKPIRVLSYQDIIDSVRCQNLIIPDNSYELE